MRRKHPMLRYIGYDRRQVEINTEHGYEPYAMTCYHSHQIAEKTLKDALSAFGREKARGHNLEYLVRDLAIRARAETRTATFKQIQEYCRVLDPYYEGARYPPDDETDLEFTEEMAIEAVEASESIRQWVDSLILPDGTPYADSFSVRSRRRLMARSRRVRRLRRSPGHPTRSSSHPPL